MTKQKNIIIFFSFLMIKLNVHLLINLYLGASFEFTGKLPYLKNLCERERGNLIELSII